MDRLPLKIAVLGTRGIPSTYSGLERIAESLYSVLAARGHRVTVYCRPECLDGADDVYRGVRRVRLPLLRGRSVETVSHVGASLAHALLRDRPDVLHLHALAPGLIAPVARVCGIPMISFVQGVDWQRAKWRGAGARVLRTSERWMVRHVDAVVAVSRDLQAYYRDAYGRETVVIPNGVDPTPEIVPDHAWLASHGLRADEFVLFVARLVPEKRVEDLIAAFSRVSTPLKLAITGGSSHTDDYVAGLRAQAAGDPRVVFLGTQPRERVDMLYRGAAAFAHPSELEGMPMAVLQALEAGLPSVVSDLPVHREVLDGVEGYEMFFPPRDAAALADRLASMLGDLPGQRVVAARAQAHVRATYSWQAVADRFEALSYEVVSRRAKPAAGHARSAARDRRGDTPAPGAPG